MPLADAVNAAAQTPALATPAPAPAGGTPAPAAAPAPASAPTETAPPLFFHKKEAKEAVDLSTLDPTKLPPETQPFYKSMQADYTRKTQALADDRKKLEGEMSAIGETRKMLESFLSKVAQGRTEAPAPAAAPNLMEEIKALRENGDHALADQKLMEFWEAQQKVALAPVQREAEVERAKATFREVTLGTAQNDKMVQAYHQDVVANFDRTDDPNLTAIKNDILSSPALMKRYVPMLMHFFALEAHTKNLENALETKVESLVQERIKAERLKAAGLPSKLVSTGGTTKEGAKARMSLKESLAAAVDTLTSQ